MQRLLQPRFITRNNQCVWQISLTDIKLNFLWVLLILFWSSRIVCQGAASFVSQPRNQTVKEGEAVRFECSYQGSDLTPAWRINNSIYSHTQLPSMYDFNDQDFSLTVNSVPGSLNFTSFQCIVGTIFSNQGYLFVEVEQQNITTCTECFASTTEPDVKTTPELIVTDSSVNTTLSTLNSLTVNSSDESQLLSVIVPVLVSIAVLVSIIIILASMCLFGIIVTVLWTKKAKVSESTQQDIEVGENEAYAAIDKYRKPIETDNNPAYETTLNFASDHSLRCSSPQA